MDNKEIRRKILEYIYSKNEERPRYMAGREELKREINVDNAKLDNNVLYLEEKGYLTLLRNLGSLFNSAQITSTGIDLVESPETFNSMFPITINNNIVQNSTGVIIGDSNEQNVTIQQSFSRIYEKIEEVNPKNKQDILDNVKSLEAEIQKDAPNKNVISRTLVYLKENASWLVPSVVEVVRTSLGL